MSAAKNLAKSSLRPMLPLVLAANQVLRRLTAAGHRLQFFLQWRIARRSPAWFDHHLDLYWKWHASRNPNIWQRGILGLFAIQPGAQVLDLCCGDGFYSYYFYSGRAGRIIAIDFDRDAIRHASRYQQAPNIEYRQGDIRSEMPQGKFDNVCWDAGIEYFTLPETEALLATIKSRLTANGILSGCGIVSRAEGRSHRDHKHEFSSPEELTRLLRRFFARVRVINTSAAGDKFLERATFHFFASDGSLPFDVEGMAHVTQPTKGEQC